MVWYKLVKQRLEKSKGSRIFRLSYLGLSNLDKPLFHAIKHIVGTGTINLVKLIQRQ